ncbi:MAG: hypothetical protein Ta2B_16170 [Termitinemataceae bacterium]|nr:MAG: hypothetical protein Ta2B_16170 [Termitinemataceae bacterium]
MKTINETTTKILPVGNRIVGLFMFLICILLLYSAVIDFVFFKITSYLNFIPVMILIFSAVYSFMLSYEYDGTYLKTNSCISKSKLKIESIYRVEYYLLGTYYIYYNVGLQQKASLVIAWGAHSKMLNFGKHLIAINPNSVIKI